MTNRELYNILSLEDCSNYLTEHEIIVFKRCLNELTRIDNHIYMFNLYNSAATRSFITYVNSKVNDPTIALMYESECWDNIELFTKLFNIIRDNKDIDENYD